jgi:DNA polymerase III subunit delta
MYLSQLAQHLTHNLAPVYFISGDEILLVEEASTMIRKAAQDNDIVERDVFHIEKNFPWQNLLLTTKNLSLFGDKKIIELHLTNIKIDSAGIKILDDYLQNPPKDKLLLLIAPKLEAGWQKIKWIKYIEEKYILLQIWPIETQQLPLWIESRLRQKGLIGNRDICRALAEKVEGNLLAAAQEIEKLALLYGNSTLELSQITDSITDNSHYNIFALADAALIGDTKKVISIVLNLQAEGVEPILVLWALTRELRALINILNNKEKYSFEKACQNEQILAKRLPLVKKILERHNHSNLELMLKHAAKIDLQIKGLINDDVWLELSKLALNMAEKNWNLA